MVSIELNVPCIAMILSFRDILSFAICFRNRKAESVGMNATFDNFQGVATWEYRYCCGLQNTCTITARRVSAKRRRNDPPVSTSTWSGQMCHKSRAKKGSDLKLYFWEVSRLQI